MAEAVAVRDGRIIFVGDAHAVTSLIGESTAVKDLRGATLLPSFTDAHMHLVWSAAELEDVNLFSSRTVEEMLDAIAKEAAEEPLEPWLRGSGWDAATFAGRLHASQLDSVVPDRPVYMTSADSHSVWVNSVALALAGITAGTTDPPNGRIERDAQGKPTGILHEDAMALVGDLMPPYSEGQVDEGLAKALVQAASYGITTIIDARAEDWMLEGYQRFEARGALTVRVRAAFQVDPLKDLDQLPALLTLRDRFQSPMLSVNGAKFYLDGVIESKTAFMLEPYTDGTNGMPLFADQDLREIAAVLDQEGLQLHAHVIGDGAVRQMLDTIEYVRTVNGQRDRRPLLAHIEVVDPSDAARFAALGAYADFQPLWAFPDSYITELTEPAIGLERSAWLYPIGALYDADATLVAGSDWSVSSMNVFEAVEVAVTRQAPADATGRVLNSEQRVSVQAILEAYTLNGARAAFLEHEAGSITVGKRADLIIVDRDPLTVEPHDLSELRVTETFLDGRTIYRAN